jgi:ketosteroid isomerase-like protein
MKRPSTAIASVLGLLLCAAAAVGVAGEPRDPKKDEQTLLRLENEWYHSRSVETLERIYAPDFVHIVGDGRIFSGQDEIDYLRKHAPPPLDESRQRFEDMKVRFYEDIGIVTGRTVVTDEKGRVVRKTSFTDVFRWRDGRWRAVNGQETPVEKP